MCWHGILTEDGTGILSKEPNPTGGTEDGTGILFEEPNPTGSRPSDLIGLCGIGVSFKVGQHTKPHPPNTQGKARRTRWHGIVNPTHSPIQYVLYCIRSMAVTYANPKTITAERGQSAHPRVPQSLRRLQAAHDHRPPPHTNRTCTVLNQTFSWT